MSDFRASSVFYFSDKSLILCILGAFALFSHYGDSISSKKPNEHHAFEFIIFLGAIFSLLKQYIS